MQGLQTRGRQGIAAKVCRDRLCPKLTSFETCGGVGFYHKGDGNLESDLLASTILGVWL